MVHGLVAQLQGDLKLHSNVGLGTNVELWLPAIDGPEEPDVTTAEPISASRRSGTVLLVDDEDLVRESVAAMLTDLGLKVVQAEGAERALKLVSEGLSFDLLITDHLMPGMTGNDLATVVRGRRPDLPVLIVSGYADADGLPTNLPRLTKPFLQHELNAALTLMLLPAYPIGE